MTDRKHQCGNCKFYGEGNCLRYPPQIFTVPMTMFLQPTVDKNQWCGEWLAEINYISEPTPEPSSGERIREKPRTKAEMFGF